jgi:hypothetical protein
MIGFQWAMSKFKITQKIDFEKRTKKAIEKIEKEMSKQVQLHTTKLKKNTESGKTFDDKELKDYKQSTQKFRKDQDLQVSPPNLKMSGAMINAITNKTEKTAKDTVKGIVYVAKRTRSPLKLKLKTKGYKSKAKIIKTDTVTKARHVLSLGFRFFGISKEDVDKIQKAIKSTFIKGWNK